MSLLCSRRTPISSRRDHRAGVMVATYTHRPPGHHSASGIDAMPFVLRRRKTFPNAFSNGLSVVEDVPRDQKAVDELLSVVVAL